LASPRNQICTKKPSQAQPEKAFKYNTINIFCRLGLGRSKRLKVINNAFKGSPPFGRWLTPDINYTRLDTSLSSTMALFLQGEWEFVTLIKLNLGGKDFGE